MKRILKQCFDFSASITFTLIILGAISLLISLPLLGEKAAGMLASHPWLKGIASADFYRSHIFIVLLVLFSVNLLACCINHARRTVRYVKGLKRIPDEAAFAALPVVQTLNIPDDGRCLQRIEGILQKCFGKPAVLRGHDIPLYLYAEQGRFVHFGFYFAHLSMLTLVIGIIASASGLTYHVDMARGQTLYPLRVVDAAGKARELDFGLRCRNFSVEYYADGKEIKKTSCTLEIVKNGGAVSEQTVDFSRPLQYAGIDIFQDRVVTEKKRAEINITGKDGKTYTWEAQNGDTYTPPGSTAMVRAAAFREQTLQLISLSSPARQWLSQAPARLDDPALKGYTFSLAGMHTVEVTSIKIISDPGKIIVWTSISCIIAGFFVIFFFAHRRIWVKIVSDGQSCTVTLAGTANKNEQSLATVFNTLKQELLK